MMTSNPHRSFFGRFHSRRYTKLSLAPDMTWACGAGRRITVRTGATLDDTNREASAVSPLPKSRWRRCVARGADRFT